MVYCKNPTKPLPTRTILYVYLLLNYHIFISMNASKRMNDLGTVQLIVQSDNFSNTYYNIMRKK